LTAKTSLTRGMAARKTLIPVGDYAENCEVTLCD